MKTDATDTVSTKGLRILVSFAVSSTFPGTSAKPPAMRWTRGSARKKVSRQAIPTTTSNTPRKAFARALALAGPSRSSTSAKSGTKAFESAPSAKSSRKMLPMRKAAV